MPSPGQQIIAEFINSLGTILASVVSTTLNSLFGSLLTVLLSMIGITV